MVITYDASNESVKDLDELRNALRHLLQIVIKLYITNWYSLISPRDRSFISAVRSTSLAYLDSVIESLSSAPEKRKGTQDRLLELVFTSAPTILERHVKAYRLAKDDSLTMLPGAAEQNSPEGVDNGSENDKEGSSQGSRFLAQRYHLYAPHPGIETTSSPKASSISDPVTNIERPTTPQGIDESLADALSSSITGLPPRPRAGPLVTETTTNPDASQAEPYAVSPQYLSHLVDCVLEPHLPMEDYASSAERTMITEVLGNAVLGSVLRKCAEPWFIWRIGLSLLREDEEGKTVDEKNSRNVSERPTNPTKGSDTTSSAWSYLGFLGQLPSILISAYLYLSIALSNYLSGTPQADSETFLPSRQEYLLEPWIEALLALVSVDSMFATREAWTMIKMMYIATSTRVDRVAQQRFTASLQVDTVTRLISKLTENLFPNGELAPVVPDPTVEEAAAMREELELCVYNRIPGLVRLFLLGVGEATQRMAIANALDVFSNASANTSLMLTLTETVLLTLVPKLNAPKEKERGAQVGTSHNPTSI